MALSKQEFTSFIKGFRFRELFNEMGWNNDRSKEPVIVDNYSYMLQGVAEKSGFKVLLSTPAQDGRIPDYTTRRKIEFNAAKLFHEHLIIFSDSKNQEQIWQYVVRQPGKPVRITETRYHISQQPELLFNRASGIFFKIEDEENITIVDVTRKMVDNFTQNSEKVTKQFYERFKREHTGFLSFIKGIENKVHKDWYASLMLNRLMFCYFIQRKGFLDQNPQYLRNKLTACREKKGKNKFYSFYRDFLLVLFHKGLNEAIHPHEVEIEIGRIPYLNGGLFDVHELEQTYQINIDDSAFERVFDFFDQYEWYLDTGVHASGKDIDPDVIGYIFEKYINDRAQMGAYYTKEDITDYISKNCIVPFLFGEVKREYPAALKPDGEIWQMLRNSGDTYIYDAVKHGADPENLWGDLPDEVKQGFNSALEQKPVSEVTQAGETHLWQIRQPWNRQAPTEAALPTEIWREVIERRKRYAELRRKIENGEITDINDFITYNLNIRQFVQDVLEGSTDAKFIEVFYKVLSRITILDPTGGSGAFLFAAMNILEPLYEACILRMENFVAESPKGKHPFFNETLGYIKSPEHPNRQYFIYKSIILNNLYGVDIMKEAVEIAKLRLFLKLVATVEPDYRKANLGLEPLPDIDFNIRAGNTLVGFAIEAELMKGLTWQLNFGGEKEKIEEKCEIVAMAFSRYKEIQLKHGNDYSDFRQAKENLNGRLKELNHELNKLLHQQYKAIPYEKWLETHQPFHWFAEFYEIIHGNGGFDVIIGNPPYVAINDIKYKAKNFESISCGDIYALCIERSISYLLKKDGRIGMIVPISIVSTDGYAILRRICMKSNSGFHYSNFGVRPSKLFDGVDKRLSIFIKNNEKIEKTFTTKYYRWLSEERDNLFGLISYQNVLHDRFGISGYPKISTNVEQLILESLREKSRNIASYILRSSSYNIRYTRKRGCSIKCVKVKNK